MLVSYWQDPNWVDWFQSVSQVLAITCYNTCSDFGFRSSCTNKLHTYWQDPKLDLSSKGFQYNTQSVSQVLALTLLLVTSLKWTICSLIQIWMVDWIFARAFKSSYCYHLLYVAMSINMCDEHLLGQVSTRTGRYQLPHSAAPKCTQRYARPGWARFSRWRHEL